MDHAIKVPQSELNQSTLNCQNYNYDPYLYTIMIFHVLDLYKKVPQSEISAHLIVKTIIMKAPRVLMPRWRYQSYIT